MGPTFNWIKVTANLLFVEVRQVQNMYMLISCWFELCQNQNLVWSGSMCYYLVPVLGFYV